MPESLRNIGWNPNATATLLIAAIELRLNRYSSLLPNVEVILYDQPETGDKPKDDFFIRLTFHVHN